MTDNTQPEALDLADVLEAVEGGWSVADKCCAELRRQHARIAELEEQIEAIGAGGVNGPLIGQPQAMPDLSALTERGAKAWAGADAQALREGGASPSANAGEPWTGDPMDWPLPCDLTAGGVTISKGCPLRTVQTRLKVQSEANALLMRGRIAAPPTAQAEGWRPIETAPKDGALIVLGARNGVWLGKYVPVYQSGYRPENPWSSMLLNHDHMAERYTRPTHWMPLPPPPTSAPQAGSQPAPEYVGNGMFKGETIEKAAEHWANWCDVRCMTGLSEFLRVVAARAPADSVTAPAGPSKSLPYEPTSAMLIAARERDPALPIETVRAIYWSMWRTAPTPPAQAADSVLEDADPLQGAANWLVKAHSGLETSTLAGKLSIGYNRAKRLHDAAIAARKQGGA